MVSFINRIITLLIVCGSTLSAFSQSLIFGQVQDAFLKTPLPEAKVSLLLAADSTVVIDSIPVRKIQRADGTVSKAEFSFQPEKKTCKYLLRGTLEGYESGWLPLAIDANETRALLLDQPLGLRKIFEREIDEVVVKATKVKMYYKGDTLVYDATAFKLPDGSMLDALIQQLPGVSMDKNGQIFVNGRRVDELLLGSRSFMRGNNKVLMENLPYYTVENIKVYEKQSPISESLGFDIDARKYVMDVNLKKEFSVGYIANVEAAGGTEDRWLGRGFLLGFTDRWRYSLMANLNNVNESRHIGGDGYWTPANMPQSLLTTRNLAINLNYHNEEKKLTNDLTVSFMSSSTETEMRQRYEQFLEGCKPTSQTNRLTERDQWHFRVDNALQLLKPSYLRMATTLNFNKWDDSGMSQFRQWENDSLIASMHTKDLVKGQHLFFRHSLVGANGEDGSWYTNYMVFFTHDDDQEWQSERYDTWQASSQKDNIRYNASDFFRNLNSLSLSNLWRFDDLFGKVGLVVSDGVQFEDKKYHDYLYHPDTLLLASQLDMLTAITDPSNSYDSHQRNWSNSINISLKQYGFGKYAVYTRWQAGLDIPVLHRSLDYQRGTIDTLMHKTWVYFLPYASYRYLSRDNRHDFKISANYKCDPPEMINQIAYRDDSQPLVVKEGNSDLKGTSQTTLNADYSNKQGKNNRQWHIGAMFNYRHRDVAQSVAYNPLTGVYTYKPKNIHGAYYLTTKFDMSSALDEKRYWSWQTNADAGYVHSLDHALLAGDTESRVNVVNTLTLHDNIYLQYNKDMLNIRATGDVSWRHSEGQLRDFETLNAIDYRYGLSARYTIPVVKTTVSVDGNMYSRRGYGSSELNTDDFVLNASVSQSFLKGKLIARIEAFDLLHQLSSTQYAVDAQGRTETWYRSLPNYVMFHLVYHWNRNPKKQK